jgi:uncharacterized damage-inducible protein DinB
MPHIPWVERTFSFDFPVGIYPEVVERYRGTPARIEEKVRGLAAGVLARADGGWSIQENIGHLLDLEPIFTGRFDDFLAGAATLRPADITNRATHEARHNERQVGEILRAFRAAREAAAARLDGLSESDFARVSLHPRLKTPMRLVDAVAFVCAHDDYHLARMTELIRKFV